HADSLTWFARSRVGDLVAFVAGGRYMRQEAPRGHDPTIRIGLDSLALLLPGGAWVLQGATHLALTDSTAEFTGGTLSSTGGSGQVAFQPMRAARRHADAHGRIEGFPLAAVYALAQRDTNGVGGTISATIDITGSREAPIYDGKV